MILLKVSMCNGAAEQVRQTLSQLLLVLYSFPVTATGTQRMDRTFHAVYAGMLQRNRTWKSLMSFESGFITSVNDELKC